METGNCFHSRTLLLLLFFLTIPVIHAANLIPDASFETGPRSWFPENGKDEYYAIREKVSKAADGQYVLAISGWDLRGSSVLSPPLPLEGTTFGATANVRLRGVDPDVDIELVLLDADGKKVLASFGKLRPGAEWAALKGEGVTIPEGVTEGRLGIHVSGPQKGMTLEVDQVGLFAGDAIGDVADKGETWQLEATALASGKGWMSVPRKGGDMYKDPAFSEESVLVGYKPLPKDETGEVSRTIPIRHGGKYRLWVRFLQSQHDPPGNFTFSLRQNGKRIAEKTVDTSLRAGRIPWHWHWESLEAQLEPGEVELVLDRPPEHATPYERRLDLFYLTNNTDYEARDEDFRDPIYMRFVNASEETEPFCFWIFIRRAAGPRWHASPGMLGSGGLFPGYRVAADQEKWIAPGDATPWVRISDDLALSDWGGMNNIQMLATRKSHVDGMVPERIQGTLEFAIGDDHKIIKTIPVDQSAPRIFFTISADMREGGEGIVSSREYLARGEAALKGVPDSQEAPARHIEIGTNLSLQDGMDDPDLQRGELRLLERLGINNTFVPITTPDKAVERNKELGFLPVFGITRLDTPVILKKQGEEALDQVAAKLAETYEPILDKIHRIILADEPGGPKYETLLEEPDHFRDWLKERDIPLSALGVASWEDVRPIGPEEKAKYPELFYQTGLFRLHAGVEPYKTAQRIYARHFPRTALMTVNLSPGVFMGTSNERGMDEYLLFRDEGLGLMWTEDWSGHGASLQQMASYLAMLRVAGRPDNLPLGGYQVVTKDPIQQRVKTYLWLQEGPKMLILYAYGPAYAGIDSWAQHYEVYPELAKLGEEIRRMDPVMEGTQRLRPQIAILYNRTAGIWNDFAINTEQDARYIHWALAHAGYDADIIPEEDVEALSDYRLLFLNGPQLRPEAAKKIADWVHAGGVLVGTAGAGTRDHHDRPMDLLDNVFGASSVGLINANSAGRGRYETRTLPNLGDAQGGGEAETPPITFKTLAIRETLEPRPDATVFLRRGEKPAGTLHAWGKGTAIRLATLPGLAYLQEAIAEKWPGLLPTDYRQEMRDFIAWPAKLAGVEPVVLSKSEPIATVTRWDHPERTLLYVINYAGKPAEDFRMVIPNVKEVTSARTLQGKPVEFEPTPKGALEIRFPLDVADAVILEYAQAKETP